MRLQSDIKITIGGVVIGGALPRICVSLIAPNAPALLGQAEKIDAWEPDLMEWRIDGYHALDDEADCLNALRALRACIGGRPLILTCRMTDEGGIRPILQKKRLSLLQSLIRSGQVDLVDIEMANDEEFVREIKETAASYGVRLIFSHHDFAGTPDLATIVGILEKAQIMGADIAKIAVTPTCHEEIFTLMRATLKARTEALKIPMITMAMGDLGRVTRIAGGLFGSDITFAAGETVSAPGQIPLHELRRAMAPLYLRPGTE